MLALSKLCSHQTHALHSPAQVTDAIREFVQEKITRALANVAQVIKEVDVTLSVRGGDTGSQGKK